MFYVSVPDNQICLWRVSAEFSLSKAGVSLLLCQQMNFTTVHSPCTFGLAACAKGLEIFVKLFCSFYNNQEYIVADVEFYVSMAMQPPRNCSDSSESCWFSVFSNHGCLSWGSCPFDEP